MSQFSKRPISTMKQDEIIHYSLMGLLPEEGELAINLPYGIISLLNIVGGRPHLIEQQQFTVGEMCVLLPLIESYPYFCPYDLLHASFSYGGRTTEERIKKSHQRLQEAAYEGKGNWDAEIRPIRNVISRARLKFRIFGIEISSILETGYMLVAIP